MSFLDSFNPDGVWDIWDVLNIGGTVGFIACLVPQLVKTVRSRSARDLSWGFLVLVLASSACTLPFMLHAGQAVFAASQAANLLVWGTVLVYKLRNAGAGKAAKPKA